MPLLVVNFDTQRIESANYGFECWKVFWKAFDMSAFEMTAFYPLVYLYAGDIDSKVYSIALDSPRSGEPIDFVETSLKKSSEFNAIAAKPKFHKSAETLMFKDSGLISFGKIQFGRLTQENEAITWDAKSALAAVRET